MRSLIPIVTMLLTTLAHADEPAPVAPFQTKRALLCAGVRAAATISRVEAVCVDPRRGKTYRLSVIGVGSSFQLTTTVFRLRLDYDPARYDASFDPFPGEYYAALTGHTLLAGRTKLEGSAGNKRLKAFALNAGLGFDYTIAALLVIR